MPRLPQIDVNLLVALDVLLEERHVTRAAERLSVTQSAMSQTLRRLRDAVGDPILVRMGAQMMPTPWAERTAAPLRTALLSLERAIDAPAAFDPATAERTFTLRCLDVYGITLVPRLIRRIAAAGPNLSLKVLNLDLDAVWEVLQDGRADMAFISPSKPPRDIPMAPMFRQRLVSMVREDHAILGSPIDVAAFIRWPHAVFSVTGRGTHAIDAALETIGLRRRVVLKTESFLSAAELVTQSDVVVSVPTGAAPGFVDRWPVRLFELPLAKPVTYTIHAAWPPFLDGDPGHRWFREQVQQVAREVDVAMKALDVLPRAC